MPESVEIQLAVISTNIETLIMVQKNAERDRRETEAQLRAEIKELVRDVTELKTQLSKIWGGVAAISALISVILWAVQQIAK